MPKTPPEKPKETKEAKESKPKADTLAPRRYVEKTALNIMRWSPVGGSGWLFVHAVRTQDWLMAFILFPVTVVYVVWAKYTEDETYIGGEARNIHTDKKKEKIKGTGTSGKTIVLGAIQRAGKGQSQVRARVIKSTDGKTMKKEIESFVEKGYALYTDAHSGYDDLNAEYVRLVVDHAQKYVDGKITTNGIENFWTLLKRALKGTYVSVEPFHLFRYLDEQSFRYNFRKGKDKDRFLKVMDLLADRRLTYKQLIG